MFYDEKQIFSGALLLNVVLLSSVILAGRNNLIMPSGEKAITSFTIGNVAGVIHEDAVIVTVPYGTDITALSPVILFAGSTVNPASGTPRDFTEPVIYRVSADDGSTRDYTVTVQFATGRPSISIAFTPLASEPIALSLNSQNDLSRAQNDTLQISVDGNTPVRWFINGAEQDETGVNLTIAAGDYPIGIYHVTALAYKDEIPYSNAVTFKVVK